VSFGHLTVSQQGLGWNGGAKQATWGQIRWFEVGQYERAVITGKFGGPGIRQAGAPDWCVAVGLVREVAARRAIPVRDRS